jgi:hypothetical protein
MVDDNIPEGKLKQNIKDADKAGLQCSIHAIGDKANNILLNYFEEVAKANGPRDRRFRIEHAQHLRRQDIDRIARTGVIASMQPYHAIDDGRWAEKRIGPERIKTTYAFRTLLDRGAHLAFGSDWTVAPLDPILGIYAAVTRRTLDGKHPDGWIPEQKISVDEALRAYTGGNAYGVFAERTRGRLAPGYKADLVLLDQDLNRIPPEAIERVTVRATVVGGRVVYQAKEGAFATAHPRNPGCAVVFPTAPRPLAGVAARSWYTVELLTIDRPPPDSHLGLSPYTIGIRNIPSSGEVVCRAAPWVRGPSSPRCAPRCSRLRPLRQSPLRTPSDSPRSWRSTARRAASPM